MAGFGPNDSDYRTVSVLGRCCGDIGVVHLAQHLPSGRMVAIKRFDMDRARPDEASLIEHEIVLARQLRHPNVLRCAVAYVSGPDVCAVSPLMGYGSCRSLLDGRFADGLPEPAIGVVVRDVLEAVDYVHRRGLIHRAIRASHVLVSDAGRALLSGFRYACPMVADGRRQPATHSFPAGAARNLNWLSPEVLEQNLRGYNEKSDVYSVGILICELANGAEPFADMSTTVMLTEKVRGSLPQLLDCTTVRIDDHGDSAVAAALRRQSKRRFGEGLHELALLCTQSEQSDRPSAAQLLTHPYLRLGRRHGGLAEHLAPAIPLSDRVAYNKDEMDTMESVRRMSELELCDCEWDF